MPGNRLNISPEGLIRSAATIASGAFLLSPLGIPFFVRGVPRILLAGVGGLLAGKVADKVADTVAENLGNLMSSQKHEDNGQWRDEQ